MNPAKRPQPLQLANSSESEPHTLSQIHGEAVPPATQTAKPKPLRDSPQTLPNFTPPHRSQKSLRSGENATKSPPSYPNYHLCQSAILAAAPPVIPHALGVLPSLPILFAHSFQCNAASTGSFATARYAAERQRRINIRVPSPTTRRLAALLVPLAGHLASEPPKSPRSTPTTPTTTYKNEVAPQSQSDQPPPQPTRPPTNLAQR
jgi:hypothetical protein